MPHILSLLLNASLSTAVLCLTMEEPYTLTLAHNLLLYLPYSLFAQVQAMRVGYLHMINVHLFLSLILPL